MHNNLMDEVFASPPRQAWERLFKHLWQIFSQPVGRGTGDSETVRRDRSMAALDNLLCGSAWELWQHFEETAPATSETLKRFWARQPGGKAVLILDALSLRETPWLMEQAAQRGFTLHCAQATASELPGDTTPFAKALGFSQRSALEHNQGSSAHFPDAWTESTELPFVDCAALLNADPSIFFWHHWPDSQMHELADEGDGYRTLAKAAEKQLTSDDFWGFIERLATGRRLVITSDHGYAHSGLFPDVTPQDQRDFLKNRFKSGRSAPINGQPRPHYWVPPLTQRLNTRHGTWSLVLGRKKWRSQGGYPSLTHGGLSLLEVAVPYIELSK